LFCSSFSIAFGSEILWNTAFGKSIESSRLQIVVVTGLAALSRQKIRFVTDQQVYYGT
jgi:hypothetical protein